MKALPGDDEDEGGDEDGSDGFLWRTFFFSLLLCFFVMVLFFFGFFVPLFFDFFLFGLSPAFSLSLLSSSFLVSIALYL